MGRSAKKLPSYKVNGWMIDKNPNTFAERHVYSVTACDAAGFQTASHGFDRLRDARKFCTETAALLVRQPAAPMNQLDLFTPRYRFEVIDRRWPDQWWVYPAGEPSLRLGDVTPDEEEPGKWLAREAGDDAFYPGFPNRDAAAFWLAARQLLSVTDEHSVVGRNAI